MRRRLVLVARLLGMAIFVGFFARTADWAGIRVALGEARYWPWLFLAILAYAVGQFGNGLAWRHLLQDAGVKVSIGDMVRYDLGSVFWSTVVPGGVAGEVVKGVRLTGHGAAAGTVAYAIITARLLGGVAACLLALALLPWARTAVGPLAPVVLTATLGVGVGGLVALRLAPPLLRRLGVPEGRFPSARAMTVSGASTLITHVSFAAVYSLCFRAAGAPLGLADGAWICTATSVAQMLPITVGGFGVRELTISRLGGVVLPTGRAEAAALLVTATFFVAVLAGAMVELGRVRAAGRLSAGTAP